MANRGVEILENARAEMIAKFERELKELDKDIAVLRANDGSRSKPANPPTVKPGQYKPYECSAAAQMYLEECGGGPIPFRQLLDALKRGGCEPNWSEDRYSRNIKIMFQNGENRETFNYDKRGDTVSLRVRGLRLS